MKLLFKRFSVALLSSAGALALLLAVTAHSTPAYAGKECTEDCADAPSEGTTGTTPAGDSESDTGSDSTGSGGPEGDGEPDTGSEGGVG